MLHSYTGELTDPLVELKAYGEGHWWDLVGRACCSDSESFGLSARFDFVYLLISVSVILESIYLNYNRQIISFSIC